MATRNFLIFLASTSVFDFALGFFGPFWIVFVSDFGGGIQQFGYAMALMTLASAVTSFFAGRYSDLVGRKPFLVISGLGLATVVLSYTVVTSALMLYTLQTLYGIFLAIQITAEQAVIGDITRIEKRGVSVGTLHLFSNISQAIAILVAGIIGETFGVDVVFYMAALFMIASVLVVSFLAEGDHSE